jgi:hypothetical protein
MTMQKFQLCVSYQMLGKPHEVRILSEAVDDDEAIRMGFVLADMLEYQGAENAVIRVTGGDERDVATFGISDDVDSIDRPVNYGSGYRSQAPQGQ